MVQYVDSMLIDEDRLFTPYRPIKSKQIRFSDHFSILVTFKYIPLKSNSKFNRGNCVKWNTNKEGGGARYKKLTPNNRVLDEIASSVDSEPENVMKKLDQELKKIKFEAFGKVKVRLLSKSDKELAELHRKKASLLSDNANESEIETVDGDIADVLLSKQREEFQKEIGDMIEVKKIVGMWLQSFN